ncbi:LytTR family DNA-binding domain-containing protein [Croceimicrobium hydrocarbonivorans]|uniref:LytTR family transcriptional regulator n=1 Tax=Croceimicrobium hydrocarbonivorans TaxID=2761580 RepID=A0A7H0VF73_9FLAO|nr:LytTR family DNA-binding domain-containing protein [Croceimicrobium hydrocarbonivorans]QNR24371.1 LytTR family transcriptional regulator [Croceimicrobium hydrocarbonivorans]
MNNDRWVRILVSDRFFGISASLFLALFLGLYRSFGIWQEYSASGHSLSFRVISFSLVLWGSTAIWEQLLKAKARWFRRFIQFLSGNLFLFLLLNIFWLGQDWQWNSFFSLSSDFALTWIWPILVQEMALAFRQSPAREEPELNIQDEGGRLELSLPLSQFRYAASEGNYIEVYCDRGEGLESILIRQTLKKLLEQYPEHLIRVHRKYVVNPNLIAEVYWHSKDSYLKLPGGIQLKVGNSYREVLQKAWQKS